MGPKIDQEIIEAEKRLWRLRRKRELEAERDSVKKELFALGGKFRELNERLAEFPAEQP